MASGDVTRLLEEWTGGRTEALDQLLPVVYAELKKLASSYLRRERADHTLQPTALVHEAFLKLVDQRAVRWQNRAHFYGIAAQLMRRILVDSARAHRASKRGAGDQHVPLEDAMAVAPPLNVDVLAVDEALQRLAGIDFQQSRIVELRFFGGLTLDETAAVLQISAATVSRDWAMAKAWLYAEIGAPGA